MKGEPGEVVDRRFRLVKRIGEGHFGVVFEALDTQEGDAVALKWSHPEAARDPAAKAFRLAYPDQVKDRCRLDGYAQMQIHHPNVNQVRWVGEADRWPYIVSDLQPGSLEDELRAKSGRRLEPGEAVGIAMQVCEALEAALKARVYHRDLCPSNILMAGDGTAKVTDFGIAKSVYLLPPSGTVFDKSIGRPEYLPPERLERDAPDLDEKGYRLADIYSLGVTLFELLTGSVPFPGGSRERVFDRQREARRRGRLPSVRHNVPTLPEALDDVVQKAIRLEPSERFQTATDFLSALAKVGRSYRTGDPASEPHGDDDPPRASWKNVVKARTISGVVIQVILPSRRAPAAGGAQQGGAGDGKQSPGLQPPFRIWPARLSVCTLPAALFSLAFYVSRELDAQAYLTQNLLAWVSLALVSLAFLGEVKTRTRFNGFVALVTLALLVTWVVAFVVTLPSATGGLEQILLAASISLLTAAIGVRMTH